MAIVVALIYIAMCLLLSALANYVERRTRRRPGAVQIDRADVESTTMAGQE